MVSPLDRTAMRAAWASLLLAAASICVIEFVFLPWRLQHVAPSLLARWPSTLAPQTWWVAGTTALWLLVPLAFMRWWGWGWRDVGLGVRGLRGMGPVVAAMLLVMLPIVWVLSGDPSFQWMYPLLKPRPGESLTWRVLLPFWLLYVWQFFVVEFFFRGYLLHTLERHIGTIAVAVAAVPYVLIHLHKSLPEALGALVAGVALGWLALKSRSVWGGVVLHVAVALTMDAASLWRSGRWPT